MRKKYLLFVIASAALIIAPLLGATKVVAQSGPEFGFTVGLSVNYNMSAADFEDSLAALKGDIDIMAEHEQTWVRLGIPFWAVAWLDGTTLRANTTDGVEAISFYKEAIEYIKQQDMKIVLILTDSVAQQSSFSQAEYAQHTQSYWNFIAGHVGQSVDVVQIYNEAQGYHYRFYELVPAEDRPAYWAEMSNMFGLASSIFKGVNPSVQITTNSYGYPVNDTTEQNWLDFFDAVEENLDIITLDLYPEGPTETASMPARISTAKDRYSKPVMVGEVGRQGFQDAGADYSRSLEGQAENLVSYIETLRESEAEAVIVYMLRDDGDSDDKGEQNFGILEYNGEQKPSFLPTMYAMRPFVQDAPEETGNEGSVSPGTQDESSSVPGAPNTGVGSVSLTPTALVATFLVGGILLAVLSYGQATRR